MVGMLYLIPMTNTKQTDTVSMSFFKMISNLAGNVESARENKKKRQIHETIWDWPGFGRLSGRSQQIFHITNYSRHFSIEIHSEVN
jgi:hypothetical protein